MTTIAGMVEEHRVDELTEQFDANGWGENYILVDKNQMSDERLYAVPGYNNTTSGTTPVPGLVIDPGAPVGVDGATEEVLVTNIQERLADFDLTDEEKSYYTHRIAEGGTFVAVEVDEGDEAKARKLFDQVDAQ